MEHLPYGNLYGEDSVMVSESREEFRDDMLAIAVVCGPLIAAGILVLWWLG